MKVTETMAAKRLVFTVTTGRSGTNLLTKILRATPDTTVYHEPRLRLPVCFRSLHGNLNLGREYWERYKLAAIAKTKGSTYIETSHLLSKGYFEGLLELGVVPDIVILKRNNRDVAKSMYSLDTIPGRTLKGTVWYLAPSDRNLQTSPVKWQHWHDYQVCYWYTIEMDRRSDYYRKKIAGLGGTICDIGFEELFDQMKVRHLIKSLGLTVSVFFDKRYRRCISQNTNAKTDKKKRLLELTEDQLTELEVEVKKHTL